MLVKSCMSLLCCFAFLVVLNFFCWFGLVCCSLGFTGFFCFFFFLNAQTVVNLFKALPKYCWLYVGHSPYDGRVNTYPRWMETLQHWFEIVLCDPIDFLKMAETTEPFHMSHHSFQVIWAGVESELLWNVLKMYCSEKSAVSVVW